MSVVIDYRTRCKAGAEKVYKEIVRLKCTHKRASTSWEALQKQHTITCNSAVSLSLQQAGCLKPGKLIGHVATTGRTLYSIRTPDQAMYGRSNLSHCRYVWCGCKYDELPAWLKRGGIVYIQWSNACVSAGDGWVWSCNQQGGFHQGHYTEYKGGVLADHGTYPFGGRIFLAIVPEDKWLQHYAVEAVLGMHGNGADRMKAFGDKYDEIQAFVNRMVDDTEYFKRWAADYVLEMYAGSGQDRAECLGIWYNKVQKKVNEVIDQAKICIADPKFIGEVRKEKLGKDYEIVQREINRLTS